MDSDPAERHIFGLLKTPPQIARDGIQLRKIGQQIIEWLGDKRIHPSWIVPGGVNKPLSVEMRDRILAELPAGFEIIDRAIKLYKSVLDKFSKEIKTFANFPSLFMGLVNERGEFAHYDGHLRVVDSAGNIIADALPPSRYQDFIGEAVEPWTYLKFPYYKPLGYPDGIYRVGPLARLNVVSRMGTPLADREWSEFRQLERGAVLSSFQYHYARLIEILYGLEKIEQLLTDPAILDKHVRAHAEPNQHAGVGFSEAPRGTLMHHYRIDEQGLIRWVNMIIATGHNNLAMNRGVLQVAKNFVNGAKLREGALNRVEAVIRAFDPCLSCSTHALGQMPLSVELRGAEGELLDSARR